MKRFKTTKEALDWMYREVNDPYIDNERIAEVGNAAEELIYEKIWQEGCCGFWDEIVEIGTKKKAQQYKIGCNYGH